MLVSIEQHVNRVTESIAHMRDNELELMEADRKTEDELGGHVNAVAHTTLFPRANSWNMDANIAGKPPLFMPYVDGVEGYRKFCEQVVAEGYRGFQFEAGVDAIEAAE